MTEQRRTDSGDDPAAARQGDAAARRVRALDLFAAWLARQEEPRELDEAGFTELLQEHPELRDELRTLRAGLAQFRSIRPSRLRAALDERRLVLRRTWLVRVAAAAIVATAAGVAWRLGRAPKAVPAPAPVPVSKVETDSVQSPLASALVERGVKLLEDAVKPGGQLDQSEGAAASNPMLDAAKSETARGVAGLYAAVDSVAKSSKSVTDASALPALAEVRATLRTAAAGSWRSQALAQIEAQGGETAPGGPFLFALNQDAELRKLIATTSSRPPSEAVAQWIAKAMNQAVVRVRAIDLDADGIEVVGAAVYGQLVDLPGNILGEARKLGTTPLPSCRLECGDWRITVVDDSGAERRFSELRILALPGEDLGLRVMFLRETAEVVGSMAHRDACMARVGTPASSAASSSAIPEVVVPVEEFWIDPCEVTCEKYSAFYVDLLHHPNWFDGRVPVHRPDVLSDDGTCPEGLRLRPIVDVTWEEAVVFANWSGKRLATETEWERVARGTVDENRKYPWGNAFAKRLVNDAESQIARAIAATRDPSKPHVFVAPRYESLMGGEVNAPQYDDAATPASSGDRVYRLADNVSEFVEDLFVEGTTGSSPSLLIGGTIARVNKGSCWAFVHESTATTWSRGAVMTNLSAHFGGIRCVKTPTVSFTVR
jgi:formylglycine-generating enzyme required for sulfatase activity